MYAPARRAKGLWLVTLFTIGFGAYSAGLQIPFYGYVYEGGRDILSILCTQKPSPGFLRPIESSFWNLAQAYFGLDTLPVHVTQISLHILLSWLVFISMIKLGFSRNQSILGSVFMTISQANVCAVLGGDTLSQIAGTLCGCVCMWFLYLACFETEKVKARAWDLIHDKNYVISVVAFVASLFWKETSVSFLPLVLGILLLKNRRVGKHATLIHRSMIGASPYVMAMGAYLAIRVLAGAAQPAFGPGRYDFHIGMNIIENLAKLGLAVSTPVSTVTGFNAFKAGDAVALTVIVLVSLSVAAFVGYESCRSDRRLMLSVFAVSAIIGVSPVAMLNQVSDVYAYNSMPFVAVLVGAAMGERLKVSGANRLKQSLWKVLIGLVFMSHIIAVENKVCLMADCAKRTTMIINDIAAHVKTMPNDGAILLLDQAVADEEYWKFVHGPFSNITRGAKRVIRRRSGRDDIGIVKVRPSDLEEAKSRYGPDYVVLYFDGRATRVYEERP